MSGRFPPTTAPTSPREGSTISEAKVHAELLRIVANALALPHSEGVAYLGRVADALERVK